MSEGKKIDLALIIKASLVFLISSAVAVFLFAVGMYFLEGGFEYSPLFATISVAVGCLLASLFLGIKIQKNGILIGLAVGGAVFVILTLVTLLVNKGAVNIHILLRLVILMLSSMIGAIIGVNRNTQQKYI
jgi:putative membrane protein (TIGR04086 family)